MCRMLRVDEVAFRLACSTRTVRRWLADGSLDSIKFNGLRLIPEFALEQLFGSSDPAWLDEKGPKAVAEGAKSTPSLVSSLNRPSNPNSKAEKLKQADLFESAAVLEVFTSDLRSKIGNKNSK